MNKKESIKKIITDDSSCRVYVSDFMVDEQTSDFKLMFRELQNENIDHAKIGRLFQRAYERTINHYVLIK